jgi:hypothetical protein
VVPDFRNIVHFTQGCDDMTKLIKSVPAGFGPKGLARTEDKAAAMLDGVR